MKKLTFVFAGMLLFLSNPVFAEEHADAAIEQGKTGHASALVEHAGVAQKHAKQAAEVAKGLSRSRCKVAGRSYYSW